MRLQHVSVSVPAARVDEARAFYGGVLELEERDVLPKLDPARFVWYRVGGDCELHLMLNDEPAPDSAHFCIVVDDLESVRARLEEAGVETSDPTELVGRPRFMCTDPFDNRIEFAVLLR